MAWRARTTLVGGVIGGLAVLTLAGCSATSATPATTADTTTSSHSTAGAGASTPAGSNGSTATPPPQGATQLSTKPITGGTYVDYKTGESPSSVVSYYRDALRSAGWSITGNGGGGGGGGSGAGLRAQRNGEYAAVSTGGYAGTYFIETCFGTDQRAVDNCQNQGNQNDQGQNDQGQNDQGQND